MIRVPHAVPELSWLLAEHEKSVWTGYLARSGQSLNDPHVYPPGYRSFPPESWPP